MYSHKYQHNLGLILDPSTFQSFLYAIPALQQARLCGYRMGPALMEVPFEGVWTLSFPWPLREKISGRDSGNRLCPHGWRLRRPAPLSTVHLTSINLPTQILVDEGLASRLCLWVTVSGTGTQLHVAGEPTSFHSISLLPE